MEIEDPPQHQKPEGRRAHRPSLIAGLVLGAIVVLFAVLNAQSVRMHWIVGTTSTPLIVVIAIFALIGFASGRLSRWRRR